MVRATYAQTHSESAGVDYRSIYCVMNVFRSGGGIVCMYAFVLYYFCVSVLSKQALWLSGSTMHACAVFTHARACL